MTMNRTSAKKKAKQLAKYLRYERPDYVYLKRLFYHLRNELQVTVPKKPKRLPAVPSSEEIRRFYKAVFKSKHLGDLVMVVLYMYSTTNQGSPSADRLHRR